MHRALTLSVGPTDEPVSIAEAKRQAVYEEDDQEDRFAAFIQTARELYERVNDRQLVTATWVLRMDAFPASGEAIILPRPPLASVTSVAYLDSDGASQTLTAVTDYIVDTHSDPGRIVEAYGMSWPTTQVVANAVTITYVAGYGEPVAVPQTIKTSILMRVCDWFENPERVSEELEHVERVLEAG